MKSNYLTQVLSLGLLTLMVSACSSNKLAVQNNNDDVYFSDVKAHQADYAVAAVAPKNNTEAYRSPSYNYNNDYYNSDYYWMNNNAYYNPYWGPTSFYYNSFSPLYYGNGWSFSLGYNYYPSYSYGYGNSWGYYGYNRFYPYSGIYSFYNTYSPYYSGINGYYGYYPRNIYTVDPRPSNPRPSGAYDNMRPTNSRIPSAVIPISRPIRPDGYNSGNSPRTVDNTRTSNTNTTPMSRPVRPTSAPRPTSIPSNQPESRPSRSERPYSPPPSSSPTGTSNGGSSSSGGSSGGRPVRPGGH